MSRKPTTPKRRRRVGRYSLNLVIALFVASFILRFGDTTLKAIASTSPAPKETESEVCETSEGVMKMLAELGEREKRLAEREALQRERDQTLQQARNHIEDRLAALVAAENELAQTVAIADKASEGDVERLVALYENMKPKDAAPLFEEMDPEFASGFVVRMSPESAAQLLAALNPKTAYSISVMMAGRNANAPKN